jgi:hypothetical protein
MNFSQTYHTFGVETGGAGNEDVVAAIFTKEGSAAGRNLFGGHNSFAETCTPIGDKRTMCRAGHRILKNGALGGKEARNKVNFGL